MANALMKKAGKALAKSKTSKKIPAPAGPGPLPEATMAAPKSRKVAGMDEDRYYRAKDALGTLTRAEEHKRDGRLMSDVHKVAMHEMESLNRALGGEASRSRRK